MAVLGLSSASAFSCPPHFGPLTFTGEKECSLILHFSIVRAPRIIWRHRNLKSKLLCIGYVKNHFLGPWWSLPCPCCHMSKPKLDKCVPPANALFNQEYSIPVSQSPNAKPTRGSIFIFLFSQPKNQNKAEYVAPAKQIFSIFLFLVLHSSFYKNVLPFTHFAVLTMETFHFMKYK